MPLLLEDGTGVAEANTWIDLDDADAYWEDRVQPDWAAADPEAREAALIAAADYLKIFYRYEGQPTTIEQRLPWPRVGVRSGRGYLASNVIPTQIIEAQRILAVYALTEDLLRRPSPDRQLIEETKSAKGITKTQKWQAPPTESMSGLPRFDVIDVILRGIGFGQSNGSMRVVKLVRTL